MRPEVTSPGSTANVLLQQYPEIAQVASVSMDDLAVLAPDKFARAAEYWGQKKEETGNSLYAIPQVVTGFIAENYNAVGVALTMGRGGAAKPIQVTEEGIAAALKGSNMQTVQGAISKPVVENYVRRLEAGEVAPPIKVDGNVIVDGNHRYVAGRLLGQEPAQTRGVLSPSQASKVQPIRNLKIDPSDWGNR